MAIVALGPGGEARAEGEDQTHEHCCRRRGRMTGPLPHPADQGGTWVGRVWDPAVDGPCVVTLRDGALVDVTSREVATVRDLLELDDPVGWLRATVGRPLGACRGGGIELLAPCDLQALKAWGVTFARSMLERVIEERAAATRRKAEAIRGRHRRADRRRAPRPRAGERGRRPEGQGGAAARGRVEPVSRSRHRAGRRDLHQGPADGARSAMAPMSACIRCRAGTTPSRKWRWWSTAAGAISRRDARQRRQPARRRGPLGAAARQGQGQQRLGLARAVHPAVRRRLHARDVQAAELAHDGRGRGRLRLEGRSSMSQISRDPADLVAADHRPAPPVSGRARALSRHHVRAGEGPRRRRARASPTSSGDVVTISTPALGTLSTPWASPPRPAMDLSAPAT